MTIALALRANEDPCPIPEQLFGQLRRAPPSDAVEITKALSEPQRAQLAVFCYNKSHLHALGLMIASTCDHKALVDAGGRMGDHIFHQSRDPSKTLSAEIHPPNFRPRKPISLAHRDIRH